MDHQIFRDGLRPPGGGTIRQGVLDDLVRFSGLPPGECVRRALDWEQWSIEEWNAVDRSGSEGVRDFYRTTESWAFDLLWYGYLQAEGYGSPIAALTAEMLRAGGLPRPGRPTGFLDFGSGVGAAAQLFAATGYEVTLADVSDPLLGFARERLEARGVRAEYLNLNDRGVEPGAFDAVSAIDVLAHVPDLDATLAMLHAALRPGGWLVATLDARPTTPDAPGNAWHLYEEEWDLCAAIEAAGFLQRRRVGAIRCYERIGRGTRSWPVLRSRLIHRNGLLRAARRAVRRVEVAARTGAGAGS